MIDAGLREKLNKILALDYFTMTPEMKAPVDVAAVVGKFNSSMQVAEAGVSQSQEELQTSGTPLHYEHKVTYFPALMILISIFIF